VSLNPPFEPARHLTFGKYGSHPQYNAAAFAAQKRLPEIQGRRRSWFCGAWTGYGTSATLLRTFPAIPLLTLKVTAAIHWQALRLWLNGVPLVPRA
jgi:hypothetical protein